MGRLAASGSAKAQTSVDDGQLGDVGVRGAIAGGRANGEQALVEQPDPAVVLQNPGADRICARLSARGARGRGRALLSRWSGHDGRSAQRRQGEQTTSSPAETEQAASDSETRHWTCSDVCSCLVGLHLSLGNLAGDLPEQRDLVGDVAHDLNISASDLSIEAFAP